MMEDKEKKRETIFSPTFEDLKRADMELSKLEKGLWKSDKDTLRNIFLDKFLTAGVMHDPRCYLPSFEVSYDCAEQGLKDLLHDTAFKRAKESIIAKADQMIKTSKPLKQKSSQRLKR